MKNLSDIWFATGYIDFEQKKYTLLAYLQEVNKYFSETRLYPQLADLVFHYNNLIRFKRNKTLLQSNFPKQLTGVDLQQVQLIYQQMIEDDELMKELEAIIDYATYKFERTIGSGTELYEFVEENLSIEPIGLLALDTHEGYLFVKNGERNDTIVYEYRLSIFEQHDEQYRAIKTSFIGRWPDKIYNTYPNIKKELITSRPSLPQPATYALQSTICFPFIETFFPIAKRSFVRYLTNVS